MLLLEVLSIYINKYSSQPPSALSSFLLLHNIIIICIRAYCLARLCDKTCNKMARRDNQSARPPLEHTGLPCYLHPKRSHRRYRELRRRDLQLKWFTIYFNLLADHSVVCPSCNLYLSTMVHDGNRVILGALNFAIELMDPNNALEEKKH